MIGNTMAVNQVGVFTRVNRFDYPPRYEPINDETARSCMKTAFGFARTPRRDATRRGCFANWLGATPLLPLRWVASPTERCNDVTVIGSD